MLSRFCPVVALGSKARGLVASSSGELLAPDESTPVVGSPDGVLLALSSVVASLPPVAVTPVGFKLGILPKKSAPPKSVTASLKDWDILLNLVVRWRWRLMLQFLLLHLLINELKSH